MRGAGRRGRGMCDRRPPRRDYPGGTRWGPAPRGLWALPRTTTGRTRTTKCRRSGRRPRITAYPFVACRAVDDRCFGDDFGPRPTSTTRNRSMRRRRIGQARSHAAVPGVEAYDGAWIAFGRQAHSGRGREPSGASWSPPSARRKARRRRSRNRRRCGVNRLDDLLEREQRGAVDFGSSPAARGSSRGGRRRRSSWARCARSRGCRSSAGGGR